MTCNCLPFSMRLKKTECLHYICSYVVNDFVLTTTILSILNQQQCFIHLYCSSCYFKNIATWTIAFNRISTLITTKHEDPLYCYIYNVKHQMKYSNVKYSNVNIQGCNIWIEKLVRPIVFNLSKKTPKKISIHSVVSDKMYN